jgi:hypothetical protein
MSNKLSNFAFETFYTTFVTFFYYYLFLTVVQLRPFAFGFHPPTDVERLSINLLIIFLGVAIIKSIALASFWLNSEHEGIEQPQVYIPTQRY